VSPRAIRIATRSSALALAQAAVVGDALGGLTGAAVSLVHARTAGDRDRRALSVIGGTGVFVGAVRDLVLSGRADLGVHSFKDLPTVPHPDLQVASVPVREDPRDALVARDGLALDQLPDGARIGTGSPRRAAQLAARARVVGRHWDIVPVRGNVDTRLRMVGADVDAVVVAAAGLARLNRLDVASEVLAPEQLLPAPAQGALAIEACSELPDWLTDGLAALDDPDSHAAAVAERAVLAELGAGCSAPVGALATTAPDRTVSLLALITAPGGTRQWHADASGPRASADDIGRRAARQLVAAGADVVTAVTTGDPATAEVPEFGGSVQ